MAESFSDDPFHQLQREIRESIRRSHPNPDRVGCPGTAVLRKVARRELKPGDPAYSHVMECSPCYEELMALEREVQAERVLSNKRRKRQIVFATSAALFVMLIAVFVLLRGSYVARHETGASFAVLNFESESALRGESDTRHQSGDLQRLPRKRLTVRIYLPLGLESGAYDAKLSQNGSPPVFQTSGMARIENGLTVLTLIADFRGLAAGRYTLGFRRSGETWRYRDLVLY